jgi:hypothetical protein
MRRYFSSVATVIPAALFIVTLAITLAGCGVIGGIIKGAFWLGVIVVLLVIALIWWLYTKFRGPRT